MSEWFTAVFAVFQARFECFGHNYAFTKQFTSICEVSYANREYPPEFCATPPEKN